MTDGRESKRARQACLNCRRKKARCSGQKPVCAFCARLNQRCEWNDETLESPSPSRPRAKSGNISNNDASLAARVALLESKLYLLGDDSIPNLFDPILQKAHNRQVNANSHVQGGTSKDGESFTGSVAEFTGPVFGGDFFALPYQAVLLSLIDIYFNCCHNQPYTYFHERTFRNRFEEGVLPDYLMYALAATACRFSEHEFYKDRQAEAIEAYASASWAHIFEHSFTSGDSLEIHMVQATSMLAVVDFTGWL